MSDKELYVHCSVAGIKRAEKWIKKYAQDLEKKANELINVMLKEGEKYACRELVHVDTGETLNSIMGYREGDTGIIYVGGNAVWIEFGTGVYAPGQTDHPKAAELGALPHGEYGKKHGANPNGWYYPGLDGKWYHTMGIPSNRFMYRTAWMLRNRYKQMASEVFK